MLASVSNRLQAGLRPGLQKIVLCTAVRTATARRCGYTACVGQGRRGGGLGVGDTNKKAKPSCPVASLKYNGAIFSPTSHLPCHFQASYLLLYQLYTVRTIIDREHVLPAAASRGVLLLLLHRVCSPPFTSNTANLLVLLTTVDPFEGMILATSLQQPVFTPGMVLLLRVLLLHQEKRCVWRRRLGSVGAPYLQYVLDTHLLEPVLVALT